MIRAHKLIISGGCILAMSVIFGFIAFDKVLKFGIKDQTALRKRNEIRSIYLKIPIPLDFRVYFFNISNPDEVQRGETPVLKEIGPYCYDEFKQKIDVVDNAAEDSLAYRPFDVFKFNQEKSGDLKEDDIVTILNPLVVGMVNLVTRDSPALLSVVNRAISSIFPELQSIYLTAKVKDILFDGVQIDCRVTDFPGKAVCAQLKSQITGLKLSHIKDVFGFSLLGPRNATKGVAVKIKRGISNYKELGQVLEVDGKTEINLWSTEECNRFKGTDGWIFHPLINLEDEIWTYSTDLCRNMQPKYVKSTVIKGIDVFRYEGDLGDMEHNEEEKCYCSTPRTCLKKGVFDVSKCMKVPIYVTLPHFLRTDEIYLQKVIGMKPVLEDHIIKILFEPMIAIPIEAKIRVQFNLAISPNEKITLMKTIPEALHPIFWIEEGIELEGALLKKVKSIFLAIKVIKILRWFSLITGTLMIGYGTNLYFKNRKKVRITPTHHSAIISKEPETNRSSNTTVQVNKEVNINKHRHVMTGHEFDRY